MNLKERSPLLPKYNLVALGGTFDRFHKGHKAFLKKAFALSKKVLIGLTSDDIVKEKGVSKAILPFNIRKREIIKFLKEKGFLKRAKILKLSDPFGPTILDSLIEALIVTKKTRKGGEIINKIRRKKGLSPLEIIETEIVKSDDRQYLSSTRIRLGEIERTGRCLGGKKYLSKKRILPQSLRSYLKKPLGELFSLKRNKKEDGLVKGGLEEHKRIGFKIKEKIKKGKPPMVITVGDIVTKFFNQEKIPLDIGIVDLKVGRKKVFSNIYELGFCLPSLFCVKNPPGAISPSLFKAVKRAVQKVTKQRGVFVLQVLGEEDLAALPAIVLSPLRSVVFYGQPGEGVVMVRVTEEKKKEILRILEKFVSH